MKALKHILITLGVLAGLLALCGTELPDGSPDVLWFIGWACAAALLGWAASKIDKRCSHV